MDFARDGFCIFDVDPRVKAWAEAARRVGVEVAADPRMQAKWLRHGRTWFVGVDALPNAQDGSIGGAALSGPWEALVDVPRDWHPAQLSVVYEGYPRQDADTSDANHRFRVHRHAAHVDGLLLEDGRRVLREPHRFILGIALNDCDQSPLMVWPGSHSGLGAALSAAIAQGGADVTEVYKEARRAEFERVRPEAVQLNVGQAVLLHRHLLHGVAPWGDGHCPQGRLVAYFRPQFDRIEPWLAP